ELNQGLAFGLGNLAWASGQTIAAAGSGAVAEATSDAVPYALLAAACLVTLAAVRPRGRRLIARIIAEPPGAERTRTRERPSAHDPAAASLLSAEPFFTTTIMCVHSP